ncbi:hypothetical protein CHS0354_039763 [Potamilus streckersoni]|uniref:Uncharacterized protein n=1 Tax=Potamilus streckersoni TaxID=2493646 RepID=A0AAE0VMW8_9BIVA|nr:hypothetical protein CHS0354_039763 [Potamilus streckersoni]
MANGIYIGQTGVIRENGISIGRTGVIRAKRMSIEGGQSSTGAVVFRAVRAYSILSWLFFLASLVLVVIFMWFLSSKVLYLVAVCLSFAGDNSRCLYLLEDRFICKIDTSI